MAIRIVAGVRFVRCDLGLCVHRIKTAGATAEAARVEAGKQGWRHGTATGVDRTLDTCPKCSAVAMKETDVPRSDHPGEVDHGQ